MSLWKLAAGWLIFSTLLFAESAPIIRFTHLTPDEGLSQSNVRCIFRDDLGQMWFGTYDGLNKYDGTGFTVYRHDPEDPGSIAGNQISCAFQDRQGNLWFGSAAGFSRYDARRDRFVNFVHDPGDSSSFPGGHVRSIVQWQNKLVIGTINPALVVMDLATGKFTPFTRPPEYSGSSFPGFTISLLMDSQDRIWMGTNMGLLQFDPEAGSFTPYLLKDEKGADISCQIRSVIEDSRGRIWVGAYQHGVGELIEEGGDYHYRMIRHQAGRSEGLSTNLIMTLHPGADGLWIGTENGGLNHLDWESESVRVYQFDPVNPASLSHNSVYSIWEGENGAVWAGTYAGGINVAFPSQQDFQVYPSVPGGSNSLSHPSVLDFHEMRNGKMLIATDGGGLNILDPEKGTFTIYNTTNSNLVKNEILSVFEDSRGRIWLGTWAGGLSRLDPQTGRFVAFNRENGALPGNNIFRIVEDRQGFLWLMATYNGVVQFDPQTGRTVRDFTETNGLLPSNFGKDLILAHSGEIVVSTQKGIHFIDPVSGAISSITAESPGPERLSEDLTICVTETSPGLFWIGTRNGLNRYDRNTGKTDWFFVKDGLPNNIVKGIEGDARGNIWVSTNLGLSRFDPQSGSFNNYLRGDGLQGNEFNDATSFVSSDHRLWFGGVSGFNVFNPDKIIDNGLPPEILITGLEIYNRRIRVDENNGPLKEDIRFAESITLNYRQSFFSIEFAALDFTNPQANQYAYFLKGFDSEWHYVGNQHKATYTNLEPGDYTFWVKASNNDGVWNTTGRSLGITVTPPFWKTGWFYALVLLTGVLSVFAFVKYRVRSIEEINSRLSREVEIRTRELQNKTDQLESQKAALEESLEIRQIIENELRIQKEKAEAASKSKSEFLANMSHEIRTPMNGVIGMTDLLMETPLSYDQQDLAKTVMSSAGSLLNIIDDILDFSKIEAGKIELEEIDFDLLEVVESVSSILAPKAHDKNLAFFLITPPEMPNQYLGDPVRLRQIIINLTNNAIKFTHQGEIALSVYQEGEEGDLARLRFSVRDTGIGIPEDRLNRLFKSFSQVDSSVTRQYGGTGLGLAISKSLAELMGGEIGVNSIEGEGSEFWFTVRLRKSPEPRAVASDFSFLSGHRILITDDHPVSRQLLLDHLKNSPAAVQAAENGVEAWDLLKAAETAGEPFTICIADFGIPGMTGEELVMKIRGDSRLQSLKTMLITASVGRADLQRIIRAGFDTYLMKPVTGRRLRAGLSKMLGHETVSATEPGKAILAFPRQNGEEIRLLLVEDNLVNRKVAQKMLEKMGFEVDVAGDGLEALQAVENTRYDLIFMDIQMPRMDGLSATRSIRDRQSDAAVPIIALTANAMKGDREKCLAAGMDGYISKPFKKAELTAVLNRFLS